MAVKLGKGKVAGINACANDAGVIAAAAMDQRGSLEKAIAKARGTPATPEDLVSFKKAVTSGAHEARQRHPAGPRVRASGRESARKGNRCPAGLREDRRTTRRTTAACPTCLPEWSVRRLVEAGASAIKILLYYNPTHPDAVNVIKKAFIERIGGECAAADVPFFLEIIAYDDAAGDAKSLEFAKVKPHHVRVVHGRVLTPALRGGHPEGRSAGEPLVRGRHGGIRRAEGLHPQGSDAALQGRGQRCQKPFIYLSAGVTDDVFRETLELAAEAGTPFSGVLCGRATWQDGIPVYASKGYDALVAWLEDRGVKNIEALNKVLAKGAKPWWDFYGGKKKIETMG